MSNCSTVKHLRELSKENGIKSVLAAAAIMIIDDIDVSDISAKDIDRLHDLVSEIYQDDSMALFERLQNGAPDCKICEALAQQARTVAQANRAA
jgi:hypothetical protein